MSQKIMITGANGQLGRALQTLYKGNEEYELLLTDTADFAKDGIVPLDITDKEQVDKLINELRPDYVVNAAAYTNVDGCEKNTDLAYAVNAIGPRYLAESTGKLGIPLVQVSTDYVFSGEKRNRPYTEMDRPGPASIYGASKLRGEQFVTGNTDRWFILRTAWLYGDGKNFVRTMLRLAETKDTITVVNDQVGSPTSALELARAIAYLLPKRKYGLYHATAEGSCSWADFAKKIFELTGKKTEVIPVSTEEYRKLVPDQAVRPAYSILENKHFKAATDFMFKDWEDALKEYLGVE